MAENERKVVHTSSSDVPNNPQPTNFIMVEYAANGPDEMQFPRAYSYFTNGGEKAVSTRRQPI